MPFDKNETEINGSGPKKADIIIKTTQNIAAKQEDLNEQTKLALARIDEAIDLINKSSQDSSYVVKQSGELFTQLQGENSALKQELLYLAKQSENIYAGLAEKINELSERAKTRDDAMSGFADRVNDVAEHTRKSEQAYTLIADKLTELSEQNKRSERMYAELAEKLAAVKAGAEVTAAPVVTERIVPAEVDFSVVIDKINALSEQLRRNERAYADLSDRVNDRMSERVSVSAKAEPSVNADDFREILDKIARLSEQLRRSDSAHSMLADKFEILSMRVEQYAFESAKTPASYQQPQVAPVVLSAPAPVPAQAVKEDIDYDKLAEKIASLITTDAVSPDYIASKVAEQIIIPESETPNVNVNIDADYIANKVVERIAVPEAAPVINIDGEEIADKVAQRLSELNASEEIAASSVEFDQDEFADMLLNRLAAVQPNEEQLAAHIAEKLDAAKPEVQTLDFDEEELANRIAYKLEGVKTEEVVTAPVEFNEEALAERLAQKLGGVKPADENAEPLQAVIDEEELADRIARKISAYGMAAPSVAANVDLDEEELADAISLKVGSLKAEDFEILVDDEGCSSISKGIADNLDYNTISNIIADKLREVLDLAAAAQPDYEEMAERISEKITVAGINEDAIAEKAAAVLSNYLPELDTEEITDKITGAVIDVVSAMPQPTLDSEAICNTISDKLIEAQDGHDYDVVIDEDGVMKITELVSEGIERETGARFDKVEEDIAKISEALAKVGEYVDDAREAEAVKENAVYEETEVHTEDDYSKLSDMVASEIEKGTASRFDKVEEDIAKLADMIIAGAEEEPEEEYDEYEDDYEGEDEYSVLSEVVAAEIERGVTSRLNDLEENIARITEIITAEDEPDEEEADGYAEENYSESVSENISEIVAAEIEKGVSSRLDSLEESISKIAEIITAEDEPDEEAVEAEYDEDDYARLSEVVAAEIEKGVSVQLTSVADNLAKITEYLAEEENEEEAEAEISEIEPEVVEEVVEDYSVLSEAVASEVEKRVSYRLETLEEGLAKLTEIVSAENGAEEPVEVYSESEAVVGEQAVEIDYTALSEAVAAEIEKGVTARLDTIEEKISGIADIINAEDLGGADEYEETEEIIEEDYTVLSEAVASEVEKRVSDRLTALEENVSKIAEVITSDVEEEYSEEDGEEYEEDYTELSEAVADEVEKRVSDRLVALEENVTKIAEIITAEDEEYEEEAFEEEEEDYTVLSEAVASEVEKRVSYRLDSMEENIAHTNARFDSVEESIAKISEIVESNANSDSEPVTVAETLPVIVAAEIERGVSERLDSIEQNIAKITELVSAEEELAEYEEYEVLDEDDDYTGRISAAVANEVGSRISDRLEALEENVNKITEIITAEPEEVEEEPAEEAEEDYTVLSEAVADEVEKRVSVRLESVEESIANTNSRIDNVEDTLSNTNSRFDSVDENLAKLTEIVTAEPEKVEEAPAEEAEEDYTVLSEAVATEVERRVSERLEALEETINKINEIITAEPEEVEEEPAEEAEEDYTVLSEAVADEVERRVTARLEALEENVSKLTEIITAEPETVETEPVEEAEEDYSAISEAVATEVEKRVSDRLTVLEENVNKLTEVVAAETAAVTEKYAEELSDEDYATLSELVASVVEKRVSDRLTALEENVTKITEIITAAEEEVSLEGPDTAEKSDIDYTVLSEAVATEVERRVSYRLDSVEENIASTNARFDEVREIKEMLANGVLVAAANETAAAQTAEAEDEQELVTVSDIVEEAEEAAPAAEEEFEGDDGEDDGEDFLIDVFDMDAFSDDELMPGEISEYSDGVDFANMMKFKRSFISRIIQSSDDNKQYYGEVKHALLSYRKVNSNVAWGAERFNKGRETIARLKIRGKTLCLYLALDPNNYKVSVYHHVDVSDNKSVAGTPMMVKVKSPLGVRKAIRLIDEMLAMRNGEKREIPDRDYAAMYPYETIEELIEDGLVKDVRKEK